MFVMARSRYITQQEIECLKVGDVWHIDSSLGGSFSMELTSINDGGYCFESTNKFWPMEFLYEKEELILNIYKLVPV